MIKYPLFHYLLLYSNTIKTTPQNSTITEPVIHDENLKGYKRNYCKIGVVILAGGVVCAVFLNLGNTKLGNAVFMGIISAEFLYGIDLLINGKKIKLYNERN